MLAKRYERLGHNQSHLVSISRCREYLDVRSAQALDYFWGVARLSGPAADGVCSTENVTVFVVLLSFHVLTLYSRSFSLTKPIISRILCHNPIMSASLAPECNEVKECAFLPRLLALQALTFSRRYDTCFLKWYSESSSHPSRFHQYSC